MPYFKYSIWLCIGVMFALSVGVLLFDRSFGALAGALFFGACFAVMLLDVRDDRRMSAQIKRLESGHCVHCGYDLRSSKETCPECGNTLDDFDPGYPD